MLQPQRDILLLFYVIIHVLLNLNSVQFVVRIYVIKSYVDIY